MLLNTSKQYMLGSLIEIECTNPTAMKCPQQLQAHSAVVARTGYYCANHGSNHELMEWPNQYLCLLPDFFLIRAAPPYPAFRGHHWGVRDGGLNLPLVRLHLELYHRAPHARPLLLEFGNSNTHLFAECGVSRQIWTEISNKTTERQGYTQHSGSRPKR
jgi:hypothetical protein